MTRATFSFASAITLLALTVSGCAGPIETRVQSIKSAGFPAVNTYRFETKPGQDNDIYRAAQDMVAKALYELDFKQSGDAPVLVEIAVAERPASIALSVGEKDSETVLVAQKEKKPLQSCEDREHRLSVTMIERLSGDVLYSGSAAEYHCKGQMTDSLPFLVKTALADIDGVADGQTKEKTEIRKGLE